MGDGGHKMKKAAKGLPLSTNAKLYGKKYSMD